MKNKKYALNIVLILGLTLFALWFALKDNFDGVIELLSNIEWYYFIFIIIYGVAYNLCIGGIYTVLAKRVKRDYSFKEGLQCAFVGAFFSGVTPSATGGQFAQAYILKNQGIKLSKSASILWIDFIIYQTVMVVYTTFIMIGKYAYYQTHYSNFFVIVLIGWLVNSAVIIVLAMMAKYPKTYAKISKPIVLFLHKIHVVKDPKATIASWNQSLESFTDEVSVLKHEKKMVMEVVLLNVLRLTILYTLPQFIAFTMGIPFDPGMTIDIITMSAFVWIANDFFPVPGGSGGTEGAFMLIFSTKFTAVQANSMMIMWRFATYHIVLIVGGLTFVILKGKYDRAKLSQFDEGDYHEDRTV